MQVLVFCVLLTLPFIIEAEPELTTPSIITSHGYPFEEHKVTTADGYILTMHRIPYSPKSENHSSPRGVAFMQHGLLASSSDWVLLGPDKALAYILSDKGFDVWLGNARGNFYSRAHTSRNPSNKEFWNFGWHQIAIFDLPAMMNYALHHTGEEELRYFGHSQGTTVFLVLNSIDIKFKRHIRSAHFLAPVAFMKHAESPLVKLAGPMLGQPNPLVEIFGSVEFLPKAKEMELIGSLVCAQTSVVKDLCTNVIFLIYGWDSPFLNETMIPDILATVPAGSSLNQVLHFLQLHNSGEFRQFDYGSLRNLERYGSWRPPKYDLQNVDVPLYMYYSQNDLLASVTDVKRLRDELKQSSVKGFSLMPQEKWNHIDFLFARNVTELLYNDIMADIDSS